MLSLERGVLAQPLKNWHRVPSAVSYTVRQLEEWLAVPLFERRHRDVELTDAGKILLKRSPFCYQKIE